MAHIGTGVEYGLHCLLWLIHPLPELASSRDLAELQGVSPSFLAKIFPKLERAGIVVSSEGVRGGYRLARSPEDISVLAVVDAIEGKKPLFQCQEIRGQCAVFGGGAPRWATHGMCAIHAVMVRAEQGLRDELSRTTLADLAGTVARKAPGAFVGEVRQWLATRAAGRVVTRARHSIKRSDHGPRRQKERKAR
jgi:Rrf2 family protein